MDSDSTPNKRHMVPPDITEPEVYDRNDHCISRNNIDPDALKIMYRLIRHDYKAYLVGGGVRDLLLGKKPKDFDIATDATPGRIRSLFRNSRIIGRRFKLAHIYFKNQKIIEVSTFRDFSDPIDSEDDATVEDRILTRDNKYGTELTDAFRRDLTINGLFYDLATFSIIDYVGGMTNLQNSIVRVIGDPDVRLLEDPVRMLRVIRHAARSGFDINEGCRKSILKNHELLTHSPAMRLYEEIKKDLSSGCFLEILRLLNETDLLQHLLPELADHSGDLLHESTGLAQVLRRVDTYATNEVEIPLTAVLSAISLFLQADDIQLDELYDRFESRDEIKRHVENSFTDLAVPRKERERIEDTLLLWWKIVTSNPDRIKISTLERRKAIDDAHWLLKLTGYNSSLHDDLIDIAAQACAARKKQLRRRRSSGGGRQGNQRSGGKGKGRGGSRRQGSSRKSRKK